MENNNQKQSLTREQKTGFVLLLIFAILVVGLGVLQLRNTIYNPFVIQLTQTDYDEASLFQDEATRLQSIDTDQDGLNDYEELNFYETSPYLPDTDSDGLRDKLEIEQGTNPLCPEGDDCDFAPELALVSTSTEMIGSELIDLENVQQDLEIMAQGLTMESLVEALQDPAKMRGILLMTGAITEEELSAVDDETMMAIINELIVSEALNTETEQPSNSAGGQDNTP